LISDIFYYPIYFIKNFYDVLRKSILFFEHKISILTLAALKINMPQFIAEIDVMPHKALLDPQGKAVLMGLKNLSIHSVNDVRVGKHIQLNITANNEQEAFEIAEKACKNLLHNPIMETYHISIHPHNNQ